MVDDKSAFDLDEADKSEEHLKKIYEAERKDKLEEKNQIKREKTKKRNKGLLIGGIGTGIVALCVAGILTFDPFSGNKDQEVGQSSENTTTSAPAPTQGSGGLNKKDANFWQPDGKNHYPVELEDWEQTPYDEGGEKALTQLVNKYSSTSLAVSSKRLPSAEAGFTSDPSKAKLPDGTLNPFYTAVTDEDYQKAAESYVERLINPLYGNWKQYEYATGKASKTFELSRVSDMFTDSYINNHKGQPFSKYIPIYADWQSNDYGLKGKLLETGPRWVGTVNSMNADFTYDNKTQQYNSTVTVDIKYSAWEQDQQVLTKHGKLVLKLVTNNSNDNKNKVLINDAVLTVS